MNGHPEPSLLLNLEAAGDLLGGFSARTIRRLIAEGDLELVRLRRGLRRDDPLRGRPMVTRRSVQKLVERRIEPAKPRKRARQVVPRETFTPAVASQARQA